MAFATSQCIVYDPNHCGFYGVEPVFALVLGWLILGQAIAPVQIAGALLVVAAVVRLGLRKR